MGPIILTYHVDGEDFANAGEASSATKKTLKQLGFSPLQMTAMRGTVSAIIM